MSVAIAITVYRKPERLEHLLRNMVWAGWPDIRTVVVEDRSPYPDAAEVHAGYADVCRRWNLPHLRTPSWGCMQGSIQYALEQTTEDWIIYVPDDVIFTRGGLWNEYAGVLAYGRAWVGGIQAPYWNATDLVAAGHMPDRDAMLRGDWQPDAVPPCPHWNGEGIPRKYINLNGAGFSVSRRLFEAMGGWPHCTWRLDEWAGYQAWKQGMVCLTLPGPPRIHYFGATTPDQPDQMQFHSIAAWQEATGGKTPEETGLETRALMARIPETAPDGSFNDCLHYFEGGRRGEGNA